MTPLPQGGALVMFFFRGLANEGKVVIIEFFLSRPAVCEFPKLSLELVKLSLEPGGACPTYTEGH